MTPVSPLCHLETKLLNQSRLSFFCVEMPFSYYFRIICWFLFTFQNYIFVFGTLYHY